MPLKICGKSKLWSSSGIRFQFQFAIALIQKSAQTSSFYSHFKAIAFKATSVTLSFKALSSLAFILINDDYISLVLKKLNRETRRKQTGNICFR